MRLWIPFLLLTALLLIIISAPQITDPGDKQVMGSIPGGTIPLGTNAVSLLLILLGLLVFWVVWKQLLFPTPTIKKK